MLVPHPSKRNKLRSPRKHLLTLTLTKVLLSLKKRWLSLRLTVKRRRSRRKKLRLTKRAKPTVFKILNNRRRKLKRLALTHMPPTTVSSP
jgi:hypothetical protein